MAQSVYGKLKLNWKIVVEKYKILKEVEQGTSSGEIARTYGITKQTLSNWIIDKKRDLYNR